MDEVHEHTYTAFEGHRRIARGPLGDVALRTKAVLDRGQKAPVLVFNDQTGEQVELDLRGTSDDVLRRLPKRPDAGTSSRVEDAAPRGPGRPRLGVVAREVTLLPRHWDWLNGQPGGASVALRKLVDEARRANQDRDRVRQSQETTYRFMSAIAGNLPGFEEASRALFARDPGKFAKETEDWPEDIQAYLAMLSRACLTEETPKA
jgi:hypothetical protein